MMTEEVSNRSLIIMLFVFTVSWILTMGIVSLLFPSWAVAISPVLILEGVVFVCASMGVIIYRARIRDERAIQISDKSARNGFGFVLYVIPVLIVFLSVTGAVPDTIFILLYVWFGTVVIAGLSAFYYYWK
jgi:uncharacterized membrane protein